MRLLITGGTGFLGEALAVRARAAGHAVTTLDRQGDADLVCDIGDAEAVAAAIAGAAPDCVVHLAAALTDAAAADVVAATRINALGTAAVFQAAVAAGSRQVVYASSVAAIGPCAPGSGDGVALRPGTVYGAGKAFGEHLARAMSASCETGFVALRFGWVYGPGRVRGWRVAQEVVEGFRSCAAIVRYPDILEAMDWTYVDDAAEVLMRAVGRVGSGFAAFNVAGDRRPIADAVAHLRRRFPNVAVEPVVTETPASGWGFCNDGLAEAIGFVPGIRVEEGIDRMLLSLVVGSRDTVPGGVQGQSPWPFVA